MKLRRFDRFAARQFLKRHVPESKPAELGQKIEELRGRLYDLETKPKNERIRIWNESSGLLRAIQMRKPALRLLEEFFRHVQLKPLSRALFLCTGPAVAETFVASKFPRARFTFVDFSERMHKLANGIIEQEGLKNVRLVFGDIGQIPIKEKSHDFVCAFGVSLPQLEDSRLVRTAREMISEKPDARFAMEFGRPVNIPLQHCMRLIESKGFEIEKNIPIYRTILKDMAFDVYFTVAKPAQLRPKTL